MEQCHHEEERNRRIREQRAGDPSGASRYGLRKTADSDHDFMKDPIKLMVEDGYVTADGTTLGADNGIAVAMVLAL